MTSHRAAAVCFLLCAAMVALACVGAGTNLAGDPLEQPEFLTPVAEARELGLMPYWLGREFAAGSLIFEISGVAQLIDFRGVELRLVLEYSGFDEGSRSAGVLFVSTYPNDGKSADVERERALRVPGSTSREVRVGSWTAELLSLPSPTRPVNVLELFVDAGSVIVGGLTTAVNIGVPDEQGNPLLDEDLLIELMAEHLRPYPE